MEIRGIQRCFVGQFTLWEGTQAGYLILLSGTEMKRQLLMWKSHRLRRVVRSTLSAETISCVDCVEAALFCQKFITELIDIKVPINGYV